MSDLENQETIQPETPATEDFSLPDDKELQDAIAAAEAEERGETADPGGQGGETDQSETKDSEQAAQAEGGGKAGDDDDAGEAEAKPQKIMIPIERLNEEQAKRTEAQQQATYWKGVADARAASTQTQQTQEQGPTVDEQIDAKYAEFDKLDEAYQAGDISASQKARQEDALREEIAALKNPPKKDQDRPVPTAPNPSEDAYVAERTQQLKEQHPYTRDGILSDRDWKYLEDKACEQMAADGQPYNPRSAASLINLRTRLATLSDQFGPTLSGKTVEEITGQPTRTTSTQMTDAERKQLSKDRAAKMEAASTHPPDISQAGQTAPGTGEPTDAEIEAMSDEERAALPESVQKKYLYGT